MGGREGGRGREGEKIKRLNIVKLLGGEINW